MSTVSKRRAALLRRYVPREEYVTELNAKNEAYAFIITRGLFVQFAEFHKQQTAAGANNFVTAFEKMMSVGKELAAQTPAKQKAPKQSAQAQPVDASAASTDTDNTASASADEASEGENK